MTKYEKGTIGYYLELAKMDGFDNIKDWNEWRKKTGKMANATNIDKKYYDDLAKKKGYKNHSHRTYKRGYIDTGINFPMSDNETCGQYLGIYIGEDVARPILIEIFGDIENRMPPNNPGFEYIVKGGYKIDVKTACIRNTNNWLGWEFKIDFNNIADYFLLLAIDDRINKNLLHVWLIKKDEIIRERKFYRRDRIKITNNHIYLLEFKMYEWIDKLKCLKDIQNRLKEI